MRRLLKIRRKKIFSAMLVLALVIPFIPATQIQTVKAGESLVKGEYIVTCIDFKSGKEIKTPEKKADLLPVKVTAPQIPGYTAEKESVVITSLNPDSGKNTIEFFYKKILFIR